MTLMKILCLLVGLFFSPLLAEARDAKVRAAFLKAHGLTRTPPGCQIDHLVPLMFNGADAAHNLCLVCGERLVAKEKAERDLSDLEAWFAQNRQWLKENGCKYQWGRKRKAE